MGNPYIREEVYEEPTTSSAAASHESFVRQQPYLCHKDLQGISFLNFGEISVEALHNLGIRRSLGSISWLLCLVAFPARG